MSSKTQTTSAPFLLVSSVTFNGAIVKMCSVKLTPRGYMLIVEVRGGEGALYSI